MSVRVYTGRHSDRGGGPTGWTRIVPWALLGVTIVGHIVWVLVSDGGRTALTALTVITAFLASASHAFWSRGGAWTAGFLGITLAFGWGIEAIGLATGLPFGEYAYSGALGPTVLGVPLLIPLAWSMMSYPILLAAQRLAGTSLGVALVGGWLLASWDLFLDPQMVGEGYWTWADASWTLPGVPGIPLQNLLGWLLASMALMFALDKLPRKVASDALPNALLIWVWASSIVANLFFFARPGVALWGGICMGLVIVPWLWRLWSQPQW